VDGRLVTVPVLASRLRASRAIWLKAYPMTRQEALFDGLKEAFHFWQGVPGTGRFDNPRTIVTFVNKGTREENKRFAQFRAHYGFGLSLCTPSRGHEKGSIENLVGFVKRHFFTPVPEVKDYDALNAYLREKCERYLEYPVPDSCLKVGQALQEERRHLTPLPGKDFDSARVVFAKVSKQSLVQFEGHRYSVPVDYAHRNVMVKAYVDQVQVFDRNKIAEHRRSYAKGDSFELEHYLPLLARKPGAIVQAKPVLSSEVSESIRQFHQGLEGKVKRPASEMAKIMELMRELGVIEVGRALEMAILRNCFSYDAVACIARAITEKPECPQPLSDHGLPRIPDATVEGYDVLITGGARHGS